MVETKHGGGEKRLKKKNQKKGMQECTARTAKRTDDDVGKKKGAFERLCKGKGQETKKDCGILWLHVRDEKMGT